ncbi:hypothetical protein [Rariglobus hedericola]|uniref:Uncharacterized protein n=1 Tax=Rariglobus hedericola TaxID=2597822 RepID=A0A556QEE7_9BACT|nr:hypothetical protein [Rariglobus hedericola]TSJ75015.1 hypothetical protein FPL22_16585 [Rariglobus hedericola]
MLNLAGLTSLLIVAFSAFIAAAYANSEKASILIIVLFAVGGLGFGLISAFAVSKAAYWFLKKDSGVFIFLYMILPAVAIPAVLGSVIGISYLILK